MTRAALSRFELSARRTLEETPLGLRRAAVGVVVAAIGCSLLSTGPLPGTIHRRVFTALSQGASLPLPIARAVATLFSQLAGPFVLPITIVAVGVALAASARGFRLLPLLLLLLLCLARPIFWNAVLGITGLQGLRSSALGMVMVANVLVEFGLIYAVLRRWRPVLLMGVLFIAIWAMWTLKDASPVLEPTLRWTIASLSLLAQPLLCTVIVGEALGRRAERRREIRCPQCGYDLRGGVVARCPECGESLPTSAACGAPPPQPPCTRVPSRRS